MARQPQKPPQDLEPYEPNEAPAYRDSSLNHSPSQSNGRGSVGLFGCLRDSLAIIVLGIVILVVMGGAYWYLVVRETTSSAANITDNILDRLFGSGNDAPQIDVRQVILAVQEEAWLETVRETQSVDVYASIAMPSPLPGRRSMRYLAFVTVTAGVNLELLQEDDFQLDGNTLTVTLPNAQAKDCILDLEASRFYDESCNMVGCGNLKDILTARALETAATENTDRLYAEAYENAVEYVQELGRNLGFDEVIIQRDSAVLPPVAEGGTCQVALPTPTPAPTIQP